MLWLIKYRFLIGIAAFFLALLYIKGREEIRDWQQARAINTAIKIEEKQREIRNHRPDDAELIKRLRSGTF